MTNVTTAPQVNPYGDLKLTGDGILTGLVALVVGLLAWKVTRQQNRIEAQNLNYNLFDRRLEIYTAFKNYFSVDAPHEILDTNEEEVLSEYNKWTQAAMNFQVGTIPIHFLFNKEIETLRDQMIENSRRLINIYGRIMGLRSAPPPLSDSERKQFTEELQEISQWFLEARERVEQEFTPYLNIGDLDQ
jgi:hypothetical protein